MDNKTLIRREIAAKINAQRPYAPPPDSIFRVRTDVNIFPYNRFFRGRRTDFQPRIWDREAGWSPLQQEIDTRNPVNMSLQDSDACFQIPCTTILPCKPSEGNFQPSTLSKVYTSP